MKNMQDDRNMPLMLRCDNPQCIIRYDTNAAWEEAKAGEPVPAELIDPVTLKELGNTAFKGNMLDAAFRYYSRALSCGSITREDKISCLSNRALVSLRRQQWEQASDDAKNVLDLDGSHEKAKYRSAKASCRFGTADRARDIAIELLAIRPKDQEFQTLLTESERLLKEQRGEYDLPQMRQDFHHGKKEVFHADYSSPQVAKGVDINLSNGSTYRGCIALSDIKKNVLVSASKALVFVGEAESDELSFEWDHYLRRMSKFEQMKAVSATVALMYARPMLGRKVYDLTAGPVFPAVSEADKEKIDLSRIRAVLTTNTFGAFDECVETKYTWAIKKKEQVLNRFLNGSERAEICDKHGVGAGLWIPESLFNHSCMPNCTWSQIGDHIFVRSTRLIAAGDELSISYVGQQETYDRRSANFACWTGPNAGFVCQCEWCCAMRSDAELNAITRTVEEAHTNGVAMLQIDDAPMWQVSEKVLPLKKRLELLARFKDYPLHIQHNAGVKLRALHGPTLTHGRHSRGALTMYEEAADIGYAVRGDAGLERAQDLWRVAGAALKCEDEETALMALTSIWNGREFAAFRASDAQQAFLDLTLQFATPWCAEHLRGDHPKVAAMMRLAHNASSVKSAVAKNEANAASGKRANPKKMNYRK